MSEPLWRAVIQQAITDATLPLSTKRRAIRLDQQRCRDWFAQPNKDFDAVCHMAGLDPERVRRYVMPLIEEATKNDQPMPPRQRRVRISARHIRGGGSDFQKIANDRSTSSTQDRI